MTDKLKQIHLAFRDGINKLTGKDLLIKEYREAVEALARKSDSLHDTPEQKALLEKFKQITEEKWFEDEHGAFGTTSFNPYLIKSTKSKIKAKIELLQQLRREYGC